MSDVAAEAPAATYFDGLSSRKRAVTLRVGADLQILQDDVVIARWPFDSIRRHDGIAGTLRLGSTTAEPLARLEVADAATAATLAERCTALDATHGSRQTGRIVLWSMAAVVSILVMAIVGIPYAADRIAPLIPVPVEQRIGGAVDQQVRALFGDQICERPEGRAAFKKLVGLIEAASPINLPLDAEVLDSPLANAFALPGGKVYMLRGLLARAENADEIAGVLAHEIGHIHNRDGLRRLIQTGGTSFLIGLLFGDVFGGSALIFAAQTVLDARYSRDTEEVADAFAIDTMNTLGRSASPAGELLLRITGAQKKSSISILNSHPLTEDRLERMKKLERPRPGPELLTAAEWKALKSVCEGG